MSIYNQFSNKYDFYILKSRMILSKINGSEIDFDKWNEINYYSKKELIRKAIVLVDENIMCLNDFKENIKTKDKMIDEYIEFYTKVKRALKNIYL